MSTQTLSEFLQAQGYVGLRMRKNAVGHFELPASINGEEALLLVDTGASRTVIGRSSVGRLSVDTEESGELAGGVGTAEHAVALGVVRELRLGALHVSSVPVAVIDLSHVNRALEAHGVARIDGAIGGDLLGGRAAVIDYKEAMLYLREGSGQ